MDENELEDRIRGIWRNLGTAREHLSSIREGYRLSPGMEKTLTSVEKQLDGLGRDLSLLNELVWKGDPPKPQKNERSPGPPEDQVDGVKEIWEVKDCGCAMDDTCSVCNNTRKVYVRRSP